MVSPDESFHVESKDYDLFGHGGMLFWFISSVIFTLVSLLSFLFLLFMWLSEYNLKLCLLVSLETLPEKSRIMAARVVAVYGSQRKI